MMKEKMRERDESAEKRGRFGRRMRRQNAKAKENGVCSYICVHQRTDEGCLEDEDETKERRED